MDWISGNDTISEAESGFVAPTQPLNTTEVAVMSDANSNPAPASEQFNTYRTGDNPLQCEHGRTEVRRRKDSAGRHFYQRQCMECGQPSGSAIGKGSLKTWEIKDWSVELQEQGEAAERQHRETSQAQRQADVESKNAAWWDWYTEYLKSAAWAGKRGLVLERDEYQCKSCGESRATEVHHLNYKHAGREPLFELVSVCTTCHKQLTAMDRGLIATMGGPPTSKV